jgi:hypothetical protein
LQLKELEKKTRNPYKKKGCSLVFATASSLPG